jgi:formylglycine-generating enzyme required for sulfatase activity
MSALAFIPRRSIVDPDEFTHPDMVWIPGGTFRMGSDRPNPAARHARPIDTSASHIGFRCVIRGGGANA